MAGTSSRSARGRSRLARRAGLAAALAASLVVTAVTPTAAGAVTSSDTINTIAGDGNFASSGDGGPASAAQVAANGYLAVAPAASPYAGSVFFTDGYTVRSIGLDGNITRFAGGGSEDPSGGGVSALNANFPELSGIDIGDDGTVYVAVYYPGAVYAIAPNGAVRRVDGPGTADAYLDTIRDIEVDAAGRVFAVDSAQSAVYRIDTSGNIGVEIGMPRNQGDNLVFDFSTDPPTPYNRRLANPRGVALSPDGDTIYVADTNNHGVITSPVGDPGRSKFVGERGGALTAVADVDVDGIGTLYAHSRARIVRFDGTTPTTIAGNGSNGYEGDGTSASTARLSNQHGGVALSQDGDRLYLTDFARIRRIGDPPPLPNDPPSADAGPDVSGSTGAAIALDGTASDPDGTVASTAWTLGVPGAASPAVNAVPCTFADPSQVDTTITCSAPGTYTVALTVTDDRGATATDTADVTVTENLVGTTTTAKDVFVRGERVTVTVTIPTRPKTARATGSVDVSVDGGAPVTVAVNSAGKAVYAFVPGSLGSHTVSAFYNGDAKYAAGSTGSVSFAVERAATTTSLRSLREPVVSGKRAALSSRTLVVAPGKGSLAGIPVNFTATDGTTTVTGTVNATLVGYAQWNPLLADGTWTVTAGWSGSEDFEPATSAPVIVHVGSRG